MEKRKNKSEAILARFQKNAEAIQEPSPVDESNDGQHQDAERKKKDDDYSSRSIGSILQRDSL